MRSITKFNGVRYAEELFSLPTLPSYLMDLLSLWLVGAVGAGNCITLMFNRKDYDSSV